MKIENIKPSPIDSRDRIAALAQVPLPVSVDLKPYVHEVEHQGSFSSCMANAACSALELMYKYKKGPVDLSRLFVYYFARQIGNLKGDKGAYPRDACKSLSKFGVCTEDIWDYTNDNLETEPHEAAKTAATTFKILSYEQLKDADRLTQIKTALAQNIPVLLTMEVHQGFNKLSGSWKLHDWDYTTSTTNPSQGWHEVLIIGYDDVSEHLLCENSWGAAWADGGFFGIPYNMVSSTVFGELWILSPNYEVDHRFETPEPVKKSNNSILVVAVVAALLLAALTMI